MKNFLEHARTPEHLRGDVDVDRSAEGRQNPGYVREINAGSHKLLKALPLLVKSGSRCSASIPDSLGPLMLRSVGYT